MPYGPLILLAALLFALAGWQVHWFFYWPAASFTLVGFAYLGWLGLGAGVLGKNQSGQRAFWAYPVAGPFLLFMRTLRRVLLWRRRAEPPYDEVAPGIYVGRLIPCSELPSDARTIVDLTSEFCATRDGQRTCISLPTLDGSAPSLTALIALLKSSDEWERPLYIHCAAGHGRSAMIAAMILVRRTEAANIQEAVGLMQKARPRIHLTRFQATRAEQALDLANLKAQLRK